MASNDVHDLAADPNCALKDDLNINLDVNNKRLLHVAEIVKANHDTMIEHASLLRISNTRTLRLAQAVEENNRLLVEAITAQRAATAEAALLREHMEKESTPALREFTGKVSA